MIGPFNQEILQRQRVQGDGGILIKCICRLKFDNRRVYRVIGKSSAKRSICIQACIQARVQGDGEIKCKKVNARTGAHTG